MYLRLQWQYNIAYMLHNWYYLSMQYIKDTKHCVILTCLLVNNDIFLKIRSIYHMIVERFHYNSVGNSAAVAEYLISLCFFIMVCEILLCRLLIFIGNPRCHCTDLEKIDWILKRTIVKIAASLDLLLSWFIFHVICRVYPVYELWSIFTAGGME
jgi:hypothetical protein